jgi:predicted transcriptional regulator
MPHKRSKEQIIAQILDLCQGEGANKTKIVYQVNLNFKTVNGYLDSLLKKGLLEAIPGDRNPTYRTTPAGEEALEILQKAEEITS